MQVSGYKYHPRAAHIFAHFSSRRINQVGTDLHNVEEGGCRRNVREVSRGGDYMNKHVDEFSANSDGSQESCYSGEASEYIICHGPLGGRTFLEPVKLRLHQFKLKSVCEIVATKARLENQWENETKTSTETRGTKRGAEQERREGREGGWRAAQLG